MEEPEKASPWPATAEKASETEKTTEIEKTTGSVKATEAEKAAKAVKEPPKYNFVSYSPTTSAAIVPRPRFGNCNPDEGPTSLKLAPASEVPPAYYTLISQWSADQPDSWVFDKDIMQRQIVLVRAMPKHRDCCNEEQSEEQADTFNKTFVARFDQRLWSTLCEDRPASVRELTLRRVDIGEFSEKLLQRIIGGMHLIERLCLPISKQLVKAPNFAEALASLKILKTFEFDVLVDYPTPPRGLWNEDDPPCTIEPTDLAPVWDLIKRLQPKLRNLRFDLCVDTNQSHHRNVRKSPTHRRENFPSLARVNPIGLLPLGNYWTDIPPLELVNLEIGYLIHMTDRPIPEIAQSLDVMILWEALGTLSLVDCAYMDPFLVGISHRLLNLKALKICRSAKTKTVVNLLQELNGLVYFHFTSIAWEQNIIPMRQLDNHKDTLKVLWLDSVVDEVLGDLTDFVALKQLAMKTLTKQLTITSHLTAVGWVYQRFDPPPYLQIYRIVQHCFPDNMTQVVNLHMVHKLEEYCQAFIRRQIKTLMAMHKNMKLEPSIAKHVTQIFAMRYHDWCPVCEYDHPRIFRVHLHFVPKKQRPNNRWLPKVTLEEIDGLEAFSAEFPDCSVLGTTDRGPWSWRGVVS